MRVGGGLVGRSEEYMVGVAAVLAGAGVQDRDRLEVLSVVERLVDRLHQAEQDKLAANNQLKGRSKMSTINL